MNGFSCKREQKNRKQSEKEDNSGDFQRRSKSGIAVVRLCRRGERHIDHIDLRVTENTAGSLRIDRNGGFQRLICLLRIRIGNRHGEQTGICGRGRGNGRTDDIFAELQTQQHSGIFALNDIREGLRKHLGGIAVQKIAVTQNVG